MSSFDIGIDLGTVSTIITADGKGIVLNEPSVIAYDNKKERIIAVGREAYNMTGRTPGNISIIYPLINGIISDSIMAEAILSEFIRRVRGSLLLKPRVMICVPPSVTDAGKRAFTEAALSLDARKVFLIGSPVAALLGAGIDISKPCGHMAVDIGGGTTDIAVASLNGIVESVSIKTAGNRFDDAIIRFVSKKYKILIGEKTAGNIKKTIADVNMPDGNKSMKIKGRSLIKGLPASADINDFDVAEAVAELVPEIADGIKDVLGTTPPELIGDIRENGIMLTGGGALLGGLAEVLTRETHVRCYITENPIECVARGLSAAFGMSEELLDGFEKISMYKYK